MLILLYHRTSPVRWLYLLLDTQKENSKPGLNQLNMKKLKQEQNSAKEEQNDFYL